MHLASSAVGRDPAQLRKKVLAYKAMLASLQVSERWPIAYSFERQPPWCCVRLSPFTVWITIIFAERIGID